jgi:hypothetical protein
MPSAHALTEVTPSATPDPAADCSVAAYGDALRLTNLPTGKHLGVPASGRARPT